MNARIVFMGTPDFGVPVLQSLLASTNDVVAVYTRPDRPAGRGRQPVASPVKRAAIAAGIPVAEPSSLREEASAQQLKDLRPDVVVVAAFAYLLPPGILSIPRYGCLNVHPSLLPRYRGPSPVATALLNGDPETGVSIMLMDSGLDTGPVLSQEKVTIGDDDTTGSLTTLLAQHGAMLLVDTLGEWLEGHLQPRPQAEEEATFSARITAKEGLLDWSLPAVTLAHRVRAYHPWPGSHTFWRGQRLKIHGAVPLSTQSAQPPGTVIEIPKPYCLGVATGQGILAVRGIQLEGKREAAVEEFLRGRRDFPGAHLGSQA